MLAKQGILTEEEKEEILDGLKGILEDIQNGKLEFSPEYEDIHSFVEANLIDRRVMWARSFIPEEAGMTR